MGLLVRILLLGMACHDPAPSIRAGAAPGERATLGANTPLIHPEGTSLRLLHDFDHPCRDPRFPTLAGAFVVGCSETGLVDQALDLQDGSLTHLTGGVSSPGKGQGLLFAPGRDGGLWRLPGTSLIPKTRQPGIRPIAPPAIDGERIGFVLEGQIAVFSLGDTHHYVYDASPLPWYPPVLEWPWFVWVDGRIPQEPELWALNASAPRSRPFPLLPGVHPTSGGGWLGWLDEGSVHRAPIAKLPDIDEIETPSTQAGGDSDLSLWGPLFCLGTPDGDVFCPDFQASGPGDQDRPSRHGPWILFRSDGHPWLATLPDTPITTDSAQP